MNCLIYASTAANAPSQRQINLIKALAWKLRPYYRYEQWGEIRTKLLAILRHPTRQECYRLIRRMLSTFEEKQKQKATIFWLPMDYRINNPAWQKNLLRIAECLFSDPDDPIEPATSEEWRHLKNRIEQKELQRSYRQVPDDFEGDTRFAEAEQERWQAGKPPYSQLIEGLEFLEAVPGIDY